jgi:hypothetical protein
MFPTPVRRRADSILSTRHAKLTRFGVELQYYCKNSGIHSKYSKQNPKLPFPFQIPRKINTHHKVSKS